MTDIARAAADAADSGAVLLARQLGIDTHQEYVIYMHRDCPVCRSEGFTAQARVAVRIAEHSLVATLNVVQSDWLAIHEVGLSTSAWNALRAKEGVPVFVAHAPPLGSASALRAKVFGHRLEAAQLRAIVSDIAGGNYPDTHIAAFLSACAGGRMDLQETVDLTAAMVAVGERLSWERAPIADKHSVGGLPGNRTTPIVVAIAAAAGLTVPKTSSRAITSPAGTADVMETMTRIELDLPSMRRVVEREGACLVWGGAVSLSPADDLLIRVARPLDLDGDAQLVASVLSKKLAAGATHVVIDMPVGPTAKVRSDSDANRLRELLTQVGAALGLNVQVLASDGSQPVGRGIGPALEARDVLAVLRGEVSAPGDLRARAITLAGMLLEFCGRSRTGEGQADAAALLDSGRAWHKFQAICEAQGGLREPARESLTHPVVAKHDGFVSAIDNRRLARLAKLAGAPAVAVAGLDLHVRLGDTVAAGSPLFTLHAEAPGELAYAADYLASHPVLSISREEKP